MKHTQQDLTSDGKLEWERKKLIFHDQWIDLNLLEIISHILNLGISWNEVNLV